MLHQESGTAGEPDVELRHHEIGVVRRDHDVAGQRQHEARAERGAVHRRDHRLGAVGDRVEIFARQPVVAHIVAGLLHQSDTLLHVGAGRERLAGTDARMMQRTSSRSLERIEQVDRLLARLAVLRVHRRPVERDGRDAVGDIEAIHFVFHELLPFLLISESLHRRRGRGEAPPR